MFGISPRVVLVLFTSMAIARTAEAKRPTEVTIRLTAYIPIPVAWVPFFFPNTQRSKARLPRIAVWNWYVGGDNRAFDYATSESYREGTETVVNVKIAINAGDPQIQASPPIDARFNIQLREADCAQCSSPITYTVKGSHDGFPSFELYLDKTRIYGHEAVGGDRVYNPAVDQSPLSLMGPREFKVNKSGKF